MHTVVLHKVPVGELGTTHSSSQQECEYIASSAAPVRLAKQPESTSNVVVQTEGAALVRPRGAGDDEVSVRLARICMFASAAEATDLRSSRRASTFVSVRLSNTRQEGTHTHLCELREATPGIGEPEKCWP